MGTLCRIQRPDDDVLLEALRGSQLDPPWRPKAHHAVAVINTLKELVPLNPLEPLLARRSLTSAEARLGNLAPPSPFCATK